MRMKSIKFNGEMSLAVHEDRKTQTRRLLKGIPSDATLVSLNNEDNCMVDELMGKVSWFAPANGDYWPCNRGDAIEPKYKVGEVLYVKNTDKMQGGIVELGRDYVKVTGVRLERIQDIDELGALAEGVQCEKMIHGKLNGVEGDYADGMARDGFKNLWDSIYPDSWDKNDYVIVYDLEKCERPIR